MTNISICCLLYNAERTRAGTLDDFFSHLADVEKASGVQAERIVLIDDKTTDNTLEIAKQYCTPQFFKFTNFADAKNQLLEKSHGSWALMVEPDMRYDVDEVADIIKKIRNLEEYKCVEAVQCVHHIEGNIVKNLYYILIDTSVRYYGQIFETLKAFPHEILTLGVEIGNHFVGKQSYRMQNAKPFYEQELEMLRRAKTKSPVQQYWDAMRYIELGLMDCLPETEMYQKAVLLLESAISTDKKFGPAYLELAKLHMTMGRGNDAVRLATNGVTNAQYEPCKEFLRHLGIRMM